MREALLVNPNSPDEIADAIKRALAMDKPERIRRWSALFENVQREDVTAWRDSFVEALKGVEERRTALAS
jgi:trehalose 6-phosphate synthase